MFNSLRRGLPSSAGGVDWKPSSHLKVKRMRIGEVARTVGLPAATIRYYEHEGLLARVARSDSNYRSYGPEVIDKLGFIQQCRSLGIGLVEIRRLLALAAEPGADCGEVDAMLDEHIEKVRQQRRQLAKLERNLRALRADCHP